jgi:histidinol-phosphate phosphatase family protein
MLPGVPEAINLLNRAGFLVIVVSNQRSVGKGLITDAELSSIHGRMCTELARAGATIHGVYYCPHKLEPPCGCRKPKPGMLLQAARTHDIDLGASWMIGDSDTDVEAGKAAGCRTVRVLRSYETGNHTADRVARSLLEATYQILKWEEGIVNQNAPVAARVGSRAC